ncbi:MAG: TetR/AcrR family transcriptional regulator [Anaerolineales bacterium]|jgi:AcrR family transcriptional regulator
MKPIEKTNRQERRKQRTRRKMQNATLELILEKGFEEIVIQDITDRADVGRGTFYFHFDDKEDILWSIVEDRIHRTEREVEASYTGQLPPSPEYVGYVNIFSHIEQNQTMYRAILGGKGSQVISARVRDYLVSETLRDMEALDIYGDIGQPPEITAHIVVGLIMSLAVWWLETPNDKTPQDMGAILYRTLHHKKPPSSS